MATWDDVRRLALALPETDERVSRGNVQWRVKEKLFVWERPLRNSDRAALGDAAPDGPILGARVEHLGAKEALLADDPAVFFTTPHFDGYPAILVRLEPIAADELAELVVDAWLARAPKRLAEAYLEQSS
ncbi:MAG TPA: MmcQ/YjbR family DNA-binding protein [Solirubrobacteraceae bacterium]